jgi:hypothetical protein
MDNSDEGGFRSIDRGAPTALKGWLSDVYFPALLDGALGPLTTRLGQRATIEEPMFGRAAGLAGLESLLKSVAAWLEKSKATYDRGQFTTGIDRDLTEGILNLAATEGNADALPARLPSDKKIELPVAVVAERRRSREVDVRVYYSAALVSGKRVTRSPLARPSPEVIVPALVKDHLDALKKGDIAAALACFETEAVLREANNAAHGHVQGGMRAYYTRVATGGWDVQRCGTADDGRTVMLEYTLTRFAGKEVPPQAGLMVYERGDSGLFRALRLYDDTEG